MLYPPPPELPPLDEPPPLEVLTGRVTLPFASVDAVFYVVLSLIVTDTPFTAFPSLSSTVMVV